jgi:hypothetical protein
MNVIEDSLVRLQNHDGKFRNQKNGRKMHSIVVDNKDDISRRNWIVGFL